MGMKKSLFGIVGLGAACAACCAIPLAIPLITGATVAALTSRVDWNCFTGSGEIFAIGTGLGAALLAGGGLWWLRRRRAKGGDAAPACSAAGSCGCRVPAGGP
jgi:LPXTG-motif cell wall-anchored protein